jgi:hypothetical protein
MFENRGLKRILGLKGDDVIGEWRKMHSEELRNFYSPPRIIRMIQA